MKRTMLSVFIVVTLMVFLTSCAPGTVRDAQEILPVYSATETTVVLPYRDVGELRVVGDNLIAVVEAENGGRLVVSFPLAGGTPMTLYETRYPYVGRMSANEDWLLIREEGMTPIHNRILVINQHSGERFIIDQSETENLHSPDMVGSLVTWVDSATSAVVLFDLETFQRSHVGVLNTHGLFNNWPDLTGDVLIWTDHQLGRGYCYMYSLISRDVSRVEVPSLFPAHAKAARDMVYYKAMDDQYNWTDLRLWSYNVETEVFAQLTQTHTGRHQARGNILAYTQSQGTLKFYTNDGRVIESNHSGTYGLFWFSDDGRLCGVKARDPHQNYTEVSVFTFTWN